MSPPTDAIASGTSPDVLILGCGYLGQRVAARWLAAGRHVAALTRSHGDALRAQGIEPLIGDVLDPRSLEGLPRVATVLYAIGLDRTAGHSMRDVYVHGLANVLNALPEPERLIYVSSTSVYGQTDGGWVDETSPTEPREDSGRVVRDAETLLRSRLPRAIVLRFAGLYGPNRFLRRAAMFESGEPIRSNPEGYLNLVHVEDGAAAVLMAEAKAVPGETYLVADDEPVTRRAFYTRLAELLGTPQAKFEPGTQPEANRRIANRKLRSLGWSPTFPSYREGLENALG